VAPTTPAGFAAAGFRHALHELVRAEKHLAAKPFPHAGQADARTHRVQHHIPRQLQQVRLPLDHDGLEALLKHMSDAEMASVEALQLHPVQVPYVSGQLDMRRFEQQAAVVGHQAPGMHAPAEAITCLPEHGHPGLPVCLVLDDRLTPITPQRDVVQLPRHTRAQEVGEVPGRRASSSCYASTKPCPVVAAAPHIRPDITRYYPFAASSN
jgi:hypothetical protein